MQQAIHRIHRTIDNLTTMIHFQQGAVEKREPLIFRDVLGDVLLDLQLHLELNQVNIDLSGISQEVVDYGPGELYCILYNLLSNTSQSPPPDRKVLIEIALYNVNEEIILDVRDNGTGLGIDLLREGLVAQGISQVPPGVPGTGIGPYVIRQIIERNGGRMDVLPDPDSGTTVRIYLNPARSTHAHVRPVADAPGSEPPKNLSLP